MYKKPIEIFMMLFGMLVVLASCNEDGNTNTSKQVKNAKPWTADYFQYELTGDGTGVVITGFRQEAYEEKAKCSICRNPMFYIFLQKLKIYRSKEFVSLRRECQDWLMKMVMVMRFHGI
ncbi:hypothetical protein [Treponema denticola]|uniref:hypothetical protein n=1 Tax=Treponema denticola TaxID=158 RepID=UPI0020A35CE4|nr:hypothetical protein [Treponema denticola]UYT08311.1 hypothetical protein OE909_02395 [Treponema denticola]